MASKNIVIVSPDNFEKEILQSSQPVLVDFWAEWCGPCKMIGPVLDELADEYAGRAKIAKVDIDQHQDLAAQFNVSSIPTLLLFKGGSIQQQTVGLKPKAALKQMIDAAIA